MAVFARELLAGLRREHGALWMAGRVRQAEEQAFVKAADALAAELASVEELLGFLSSKPPEEALPVLGAVDPGAIAAQVQALQALAARLRQRQVPVVPGARPGQPAARPPGTAPMGARGPATTGLGPARPAPRSAATPAPSAADQVLGLLRRWSSGPQVEQKAAAPTPAERLAAALGQARQTFDAAHTLAREILAYVSPRLGVVKVALDATGLPGRKRAMDEIKRTLRADAEKAGVPDAQMGYLPPMVKLFDGSMDAVRRVHPALVQWQEVQSMSAEAEVLIGALRATRADTLRGRQLLDEFETGKYRAAVYPLTHLHLTFKGLPHVADLFPPPAKTGDDL